AQVKNFTQAGDRKELVQTHPRQQTQRRIVAAEAVRKREFGSASARRLSHEASGGAADQRAVAQLGHRLETAVQSKTGLDRRERLGRLGKRVKVELTILRVVDEEVARPLQVGQQA